MKTKTMKTETPDYILISEKKLSKATMRRIEKEIISYYEEADPGKKIDIVWYKNTISNKVSGVSILYRVNADGSEIKPKIITPPPPHDIAGISSFLPSTFQPNSFSI